MSTLVATRIGDGTYIATTEKVVRGSAHAYCVFVISGGVPSIATGSYNIDSVTDGGVGEPWMNLTNSLISISQGSSFISPAIYSGGQEYPLQSGSQIVSTSVVECYCGSDNTTRNDWTRGNFTLIGNG